MTERVRNSGVGWQGIREREDIRNDGQSLIKWQLLARPTEVRFNLDCKENSQEVFCFSALKGFHSASQNYFHWWLEMLLYL